MCVCRGFFSTVCVRINIGVLYGFKSISFYNDILMALKKFFLNNGDER